jgi:hypothetical protein
MRNGTINMNHGTTNLAEVEEDASMFMYTTAPIRRGGGVRARQFPNIFREGMMKATKIYVPLLEFGLSAFRTQSGLATEMLTHLVKKGKLSL